MRIDSPTSTHALFSVRYLLRNMCGCPVDDGGKGGINVDGALLIHRLRFAYLFLIASQPMSEFFHKSIA